MATLQITMILDRTVCWQHM